MRVDLPGTHTFIGAGAMVCGTSIDAMACAGARPPARNRPTRAAAAAANTAVIVRTVTTSLDAARRHTPPHFSYGSHRGDGCHCRGGRTAFDRCG